ncbi:MAG: hypothetical protein KAJ22_00530 [Candidatus Izimaplasma sp.]|nr:hypothetical protein [Candidatus Izimaplasma bacterium]
MGKSDSVKFFVRFLLLTVLTILLVTISFVFAGMGGAGLVIGGLIVMVNVIFLLTFLVMAIYKLFKHMFDKEKEHFDFMYIINLLFALLVNGVFLTFYFVIMAGFLIILLPFFA